MDSVPAWVVMLGQGRSLPFRILWGCYCTMKGSLRDDFRSANLQVPTVGFSPQKQMPSSIKKMRGNCNWQDRRGREPPEPGKACRESQKGKDASYAMLGRFDGIVEVTWRKRHPIGEHMFLPKSDGTLASPQNHLMGKNKGAIVKQMNRKHYTLANLENMG